MKAAVLTSPQSVTQRPLRVTEVPDLKPGPNQVLLRVRACGVCRTDLHIVEGELPPKVEHVIPGHQIVGEVVGGATAELTIGSRVGVCWLGGTDGTCRYCRSGAENLCDAPTFTGYTVHGGYAEYALARADFVFPLPAALDDLHAAPLLCAGIIGFRSLRVAGVEQGERVGLFGFGASAHLAIAVLQRLEMRGIRFDARRIAPAAGRIAGRELGGQRDGEAAGGTGSRRDLRAQRRCGVAALASLRKGGVVAINAIHLDRIPQFDYDTLLWGERQCAAWPT